MYDCRNNLLAIFPREWSVGPETISLVVMIISLSNSCAAQELSAGKHLNTSFVRESFWEPHVESRNWKYVVIHHTATESGSLDQIHRAHLQRKDSQGRPWRGIGYHFVIGNGQGMKDGQVEPTFRWQGQIDGAHAGQEIFNKFGIGVCLIGNFEANKPSQAQLDSLKKLLAYLDRTYAIHADHVLGHGQIKSTQCPGQKFPLNNYSRYAPDESL